MNTPSAVQNHHSNTSFQRHAIVIGSSMAGLTIARVLTDHFDQVTIIERDQLVETAEFRKGVPQARHGHALLLRGQQILNQLFPGLTDELIANGAVQMNLGAQVYWSLFGQARTLYQSALYSLGCSRPLLESTVYRRVLAHPRVRVIQRSEVIGLETDAARTRATGVRLRPINAERDSEGITTLAADLVVDASGRSSRAPAWLTDLGYTPPEEITISSAPAYASRIYKRPAAMPANLHSVYLQPYLPSQTRGGIILPMEGDRVIVTLIGMAGDYPPTDEAEFLEFARSLPDQSIYNLIKDGEPLAGISGFRRCENRERAYNKMARYLEGFLVAGDAAYAFNPVYGQGMTVAAISSMTLDRCLREQRKQQGVQDLTGLARRFQAQLTRDVGPAWQLSTSEDRRWDVLLTGAAPKVDPVTGFSQRYLEQLIKASLTMPAVAEALFLVMNMVASPLALFRPDIVARVVASQLRGRGKTAAAPSVSAQPAQL